jgi:hypothetical protein
VKSARDVLECSSKHLHQLNGKTFDILNIGKPGSLKELVEISKIVSKLSPILGNLIEYRIVDFLNTLEDLKLYGNWIRQDPGFPDALFSSEAIMPQAGFEIKAWFPLATEITARFKDSQKHFMHNQTDVILLAWIPEYILFGKPKIIDIEIFTGISVAKARDLHYHNPPDYIVLEPEDTSTRTANLQQTNTNGYKFQGSNEKSRKEEFSEAQKFIKSMGENIKTYDSSSEYQGLMRDIMSKYKYRLDTNFAKIDRIRHEGIETFKSKVDSKEYMGHTIKEWKKIISDENELELNKLLGTLP